MNKITRLLAVAGISGALAVGAAGVAQASPSPDRGAQRSPDVASRVDRSGSSKDHSKKDHSKKHDQNKKHDHSKNHK